MENKYVFKEKSNNAVKIEEEAKVYTYSFITKTGHEGYQTEKEIEDGKKLNLGSDS